MIRRVSRGASTYAVPGFALACAVSLAGHTVAAQTPAAVSPDAPVASATATAPDAPVPAPAPVPQPAYVVRPLLLPPGALEVRFGFGVAGSHIASSFGPGRTGLGLHAESTLGLVRRVELTGGAGLRLPTDGALLAADRYARVGRDEVFQTGNEILGNPYVRARVALLDQDDLPVHVAVEGIGVVPVASATAWAFGLGAPVHLVVTPWLRVETGLFVLILPSGTSLLRNVVSVPLRVNVALGSRVVLGLVTGVNAANVTRDTAYPAQIPLGLQGIFRLEPRTDLVLQWLLPTLSPQGTDAMGFGIGLTERLL